MTTLDRFALLLLTSSVWLLMVSVKTGSNGKLAAILLLAATILLIVSSLKGPK